MTAPQGLEAAANPFTETIEKDYFVGRETELAVFTTNLKGLHANRPIHAYVAGLHGTGKTFFLHKLAEIARAANSVGVTSTLDVGVTGYIQISGILRAVLSAVQTEMLRVGVPSGAGLGSDWDLGQTSKHFQHPRQSTLISDAVRQDFETLAEYAKAAGRSGIVICIDEGQRVEPLALSVLKNALQPLGTYMVILSLRITTDTRGAAAEGRLFLEERASSAEGDIGAARLFVTGIAMGPFANDPEVLGFFEKRTAHGQIRFPSNLALKIGEIADRVPRDLVRISSHVYTRAITRNVVEADVALLNDCFPEMQPTEMRETFELSADSSEDLKTILKALCAFSNPATGLEILNQAYPEMPEALRTITAQGIERQLDQLCMLTPFLLKTKEEYGIVNGVYRYALEMALGVT